MTVNTFIILLLVAYTLGEHSEMSVDGIQSYPSLQPKLNFENEYKLFLEELNNGTAKHTGKSRQKRYVYLNTETNLDVGYLIVIPITVVLPSMTNLFNNWRRKRSVDNFNVTNISDEMNPSCQLQVDRISSYFDLMNVPERACQIRAVCELSAEPTNYFPLSDVILSKLRNPSVITSQFSDNTSTKPSLFQLYTQAADDGVSYGKQKCETNYGKSCKYSIDKLLNMPVMKFWKKVKSQLRLKFDDDAIEST